MASKVRFVPHVLAEMVLARNFDRVPEPDSVMDRQDQVAAYANAGSSGGGMFAVHLFHAACMSQSIQGARKVLDLACGPATQLLLTARLHPEIHFVGVDLSPPMLEAAERSREALGLTNVEFRQGDITNLDSFKGEGFEAITSTLALHHLPDLDSLRRCARQISSLSGSTTRIYLADLLRPRRAGTVDFLTNNSADIQPKVFNDDFRNSMRAAFHRADFSSVFREHFPGCEMISMFPLALFVIIRTKPRPLSDFVWQQLEAFRSAQPPRVLRDLDEIRTFFRLGGLKPDPFRL
jgi:arsenite methyltransferase